MQGNVTVAPARWWHVPGLSRLIRETRRRRSEGAAILWAAHWSPSLGLLQSVWTPPMPGVGGPRSYVAEQNARPVGLGQMRPRTEPHQWEVVYLALERQSAPAGPHPGAGAEGAGAGPALVRPGYPLPAPDRRAARLLGELCDAGVLLGAERLFASIMEEGGRYELFKQIGFSPVVREYVYFRARGDAEAHQEGQAPAPHATDRTDADIPGLRPQQRADAFGLLQLYQECTPKTVQMAEGKRSRSWDLPPAGLGQRLAGHPPVHRFVVERDARKVAWLHLGREGRGAHTVKLMVDPRANDLIAPLLRFALVRTGGRGDGRHPGGPSVLVRAREHERALIGVLEANGFAAVETRLLMVKQLAATVRHQHQLLPGLEKVV
jgi:hypothetical protein